MPVVPVLDAVEIMFMEPGLLLLFGDWFRFAVEY